MGAEERRRTEKGKQRKEEKDMGEKIQWIKKGNILALSVQR